MDDCSVSEACSLGISDIQTSIKPIDKCLNCERLESELYKAQLEISSYEKVIQVLRDELYHVGPHAQPEYRNRTIYHDEQHRSYSSKDDWTQVTATLGRKTKTSNNHLIQLIPPTHNKYEVLSNLKEERETPNPAYKKTAPPNTRGHRTNTRKAQIVKSAKKVKHKVLIIGDSHARNSASLLQDNLSKDYEASSFIKPGAQMHAITGTAGEAVKSLKCDDVVVIWGGSNDISRNNVKDALKNVNEFVKGTMETNIVLINAPHRHDLIPDSCVNKEVAKFNRQLKKIVKLYPNVHLLEANLDRNYFTRHGMHLNPKGKELLSQQLAAVVENVFSKEQSVPIITPWEAPSLVPNDSETQDLSTDDKRPELAGFLQHRRKCPVRRNQDFLWT